jgi:polyphosphate kinase 2 (PPK2 family)
MKICQELKRCDVTPQFWENRMQQINNFEKHITQNGTIILKFFCI